jgi:ubiquinone/menaquinone biosynthesis C-methylase UbiE
MTITTEPNASSDPTEVEAFLGHAMGQAAAALNSILVVLGDRLELWRTLATGGPVTVVELADRTEVEPRLLAEWTAAQAANGMLRYNAHDETFELTDPARLVLADEDNPFSIIAGFAMLPLLWDNLDSLTDAFRRGDTTGWRSWPDGLHAAEARFTRPLHRNLLVDVYLAGVPGLLDRLESGGRVADIGCGYGTSTLVLAERFPRSTFVGVDFHDHAIATARAAADDAGVTDRVTFEVADAATFPGNGFDLVLFCDSLHDLGDPVAAAHRAHDALAPGGWLVTLDPAAGGDSLAENLADPMAALLYPVSTMICTPSAVSQHGPHALGALGGEAAIRHVLTDAGFDDIGRVPGTPMNMVLYAATPRSST